MESCIFAGNAVTDYTEKPHVVPEKKEAVAQILATVTDRSRCLVERDAA
jgi:hypothetical protein